MVSTNVTLVLIVVAVVYPKNLLCEPPPAPPVQPTTVPAKPPPGTVPPGPPGPPAPQLTIAYPTAPRDDKIIPVYTEKNFPMPDVYQSLEDLKSDTTKKFMDAENKICQDYLSQSEFHDVIKKTVTNRWNYPKKSIPYQIADNLFIVYTNTGIQEQDVWNLVAEPKGQPKVLIDPNTLGENGSVTLGEAYFSADGSLLVYQQCQKDADWCQTLFMDLKTGKLLPDVLEMVSGDFELTADRKGLIYVGYHDQPNKKLGDTDIVPKIWLHTLGKQQKDDIVIFSFDDPKIQFSFESTFSRDYIILRSFTDESESVALHICDLSAAPGIVEGKLDFKPVAGTQEMKFLYTYVANNKNEFLFKTNKDAPNFKIVKLDITTLDATKATDFVLEDKENELSETWAAFTNHIIVQYSSEVQSKMLLISIDNGKTVHEFDVKGYTVVDFYGRRLSPHFFYTVSSFLTPGMNMYVDLSQKELNPELLEEIKIPNYDSSKFKSELVTYTSKDQTPLQMQLVYNKNMKKDGKSPCVLFPFMSLQPIFSLFYLFIFDNFDGVVGIPKLRGAGDYGTAWYDAGIKDKIQNSIDDFLAAVNFAIENKYAEPAKLHVNAGGSKTGLVAAACANQQPASFGSVILIEPILDMMKYDQYKFGKEFVSIFGQPKDLKYFDTLKAISPLHNLPDPAKKVQYPGLYIKTTDDPYMPAATAHSLKFAAAVQYAYGKADFQKNPLILSVLYDADSTTKTDIEENVNSLVFISKSLAVPFHE